MFGRKEIESLKEEIRILKEENKKLEKSYGLSVSKELREKVDNLQRQNEFYEDEISRLKGKLKELDIYKSNADDEIGELKEQLQQKENELNKIKIGHDDLLEKNNNLNQENEILKQTISTQDKELKAYIQAINNASLIFQKSAEEIKTKPKKEKK